MTGTVDTSDLTRYLDLSEEKREEIRRMQRDMYKAVREVLRNMSAGSKEREGESPDARFERYRQIQRQAQSDFQARRDSILTREQAERLRRLEEAAALYHKQVRDAYGRAVQALRDIAARAENQ